MSNSLAVIVAFDLIINALCFSPLPSFPAISYFPSTIVSARPIEADITILDDGASENAITRSLSRRNNSYDDALPRTPLIKVQPDFFGPGVITQPPLSQAKSRATNDSVDQFPPNLTIFSLSLKNRRIDRCSSFSSIGVRRTHRTHTRCSKGYKEYFVQYSPGGV